MKIWRKNKIKFKIKNLRQEIKKIEKKQKKRKKIKERQFIGNEVWETKKMRSRDIFVGRQQNYKENIDK